MNVCCKDCKKHNERTHPKKLVLTLDKIAKMKSKYAECLIDQINDQYDLEQFVKDFLLY